jgi:hypothetical protein
VLSPAGAARLRRGSLARPRRSRCGPEVPARGRAVVSVRQNLPLLINRGKAASSPGCLSCWGATLGGVIDPARSALGITAAGRLIWAGGEHLTVAALAHALLAEAMNRRAQWL